MRRARVIAAAPSPTGVDGGGWGHDHRDAAPQGRPPPAAQPQGPPHRAPLALRPCSPPASPLTAAQGPAGQGPPRLSPTVLRAHRVLPVLPVVGVGAQRCRHGGGGGAPAPLPSAAGSPPRRSASIPAGGGRRR